MKLALNKKICILLLVVIIPVTCICQAKTSRLAKKYFNQAVTLINKKYYLIDSVDFNKALKEVKPMLNRAQTTADTYPAIRRLLQLINAKHSGLFDPGTAEYFTNKTTALVYPTGKLIDSSIGYLKVPGYIAPLHLITRWADSLLSIINDFDKFNLRGWVIDLRGNRGGSQTPMIAGLAPFLEDGLLFTNNNNKGLAIDYVHLKNGWLTVSNNRKWSEVTETSYRIALRNQKLPVAVLIDSTTGSSGERAAFVLKSNPSAKFFGNYTAGFMTGNIAFTLSDKAMLYITTSSMYNKHGRQVEEKIKPDVFISNSDNREKAITEAIKWIAQKRNEF
jgi:carboxyl-terminal processing protease